MHHERDTLPYHSSMNSPRPRIASAVFRITIATPLLLIALFCLLWGLLCLLGGPDPQPSRYHDALLWGIGFFVAGAPFGAIGFLVMRSGIRMLRNR
jgi:hypothetical protein